jgi:hypothetical protein
VLKSSGDLTNQLVSNNGSVSALVGQTSAQQDMQTLMTAFGPGGSSNPVTTQAITSPPASRTTGISGGSSLGMYTVQELLSNVGKHNG